MRITHFMVLFLVLIALYSICLAETFDTEQQLRKVSIGNTALLTSLELFPEVEQVSVCSLSTRAFHLGWREIESEEFLEEGSLLSHRAPFLKAPYKRLIYLLEEDNAAYAVQRVGEDCAVFSCRGSIYGYSLSSFTQLSTLRKSETVRYLEVKWKLSPVEAEALSEMFPNVHIINVHESISSQSLSVLLKKLEIFYCAFCGGIDLDNDDDTVFESCPFLGNERHPEVAPENFSLLAKEETLKYYECYDMTWLEKTEHPMLPGCLQGLALSCIPKASLSKTDAIFESCSPIYLVFWEKDSISREKAAFFERHASSSNLISLFVSAWNSALNDEENHQEYYKWRLSPGGLLFEKAPFDLAVISKSVRYLGFGDQFGTKGEYSLPDLKYLTTNYNYSPATYINEGYTSGSTDVSAFHHKKNLSQLKQLLYLDAFMVDGKTVSFSLPNSLKYIRASFVVECLDEFLKACSTCQNLQTLRIGCICATSPCVQPSLKAAKLEAIALHEIRILPKGSKHKVQNSPEHLKEILPHLLPEQKLKEIDLSGTMKVFPDKEIWNSLNTDNLVILGIAEDWSNFKPSTAFEIIAPVWKNREELLKRFKQRKLLISYKGGDPVKQHFLAKLVGLY